MQYLYSKELADTIHAATKYTAVEAIESGLDPQLAVVLVGNHPASVRYVAIKSRQAKADGVILSLYHLEEGSAFEEVREVLAFLNSDPEIHGTILQLPLPEQFTVQQTEELIQTISPEKDVDGLRGDWQKLSHTQTSLAALSAPSPYAMPPMVNSVVSLLDHYQISLTDKKIVLVGEGRLAGGPLLTYFKKLDLDVVAVNEESEQILAISKEADILISATGVDNLITYQWVKEGAVVIDCAADIHEDSVVQVASALAPAKGGVGPLTVAWLLHNTVQASIQSRRNHG